MGLSTLKSSPPSALFRAQQTHSSVAFDDTESTSESSDSLIDRGSGVSDEKNTSVTLTNHSISPFMFIILFLFHAVSGTLALPNASNSSVSATTPAPLAASTLSPNATAQEKLLLYLPRATEPFAIHNETYQLYLTLRPLCDFNQLGGIDWGRFTGFCGPPQGSPPAPFGTEAELTDRPLEPSISNLDIQTSNRSITRLEGITAIHDIMCLLNVGHKTWKFFDDLCDVPNGTRPDYDLVPLEM